MTAVRKRPSAQVASVTQVMPRTSTLGSVTSVLITVIAVSGTRLSVLSSAQLEAVILDMDSLSTICVKVRIIPS